MKDKIRPIYSELQGYLSQVPPPSSDNTWFRDRTLWTQVNALVDELNLVTQKDYSRFKIHPDAGAKEEFMYYSAYRSNLGGLIARLHAEYFINEEPPFRSMPSTVINQTQTQTQSVDLLLAQLDEKIFNELPKHSDGSPERGFLEKLKLSLPTIKTGVDILGTILKIGSEFGLNSSQISTMLHL